LLVLATFSAKEIRDLRRRLRTGSVHPAVSAARPRRQSRIDVDGNEVTDDEEEEDDESDEDEQFVRLKTTMLSLWVAVPVRMSR
jgi:hypothetical protein